MSRRQSSIFAVIVGGSGFSGCSSQAPQPLKKGEKR